MMASNSENIQTRKSKNNCCVVGCNNLYINTTKEISFYRFPKRKHEDKKLEMWIKAVKRINIDGSQWRPTNNTRICSVHFMGNRKSNIEKDPSYIPTIFPKVYKSKNVTTKDRYNRWKQRADKKITDLIDDHDNAEPMDIDMNQSNSQPVQKKDFSCQVYIESNEKQFHFECSIYADGTSTQCNTMSDHSLLQPKQKKIEANTQTDDEIAQCSHGFHGFSSFVDLNEKQWTSLTGVSKHVFELFLSILLTVNINDSKISIKNKLLIYLIKMKTGLSYTAIGILFNCHRITISTIFKTILEILFHKTQNFIFWPTKEAIKATMPKSFLENYPNCRVIIDCTEIKVEMPKEIDKRVFLYSNYKSNYTSKFLIGIAPSGMITFLSKCYGGRTSDSMITNDCGLLKLIEPGDIVLADKGFPGIQSTTDAIIVMPPFVHDGELSQQELEETYSIASVRIHVERAIQRLKNFNILQLIPRHLFEYLDRIVFMTAVMTNLDKPILKE